MAYPYETLFLKRLGLDLVHFLCFHLAATASPVSQGRDLVRDEGSSSILMVRMACENPRWSGLRRSGAVAHDALFALLPLYLRCQATAVEKATV